MAQMAGGRTPSIDERTGVRNVCMWVLLCAITRTCIVKSLEIALPLTGMTKQVVKYLTW